MSCLYFYPFPPERAISLGKDCSCFFVVGLLGFFLSSFFWQLQNPDNPRSFREAVISNFLDSTDWDHIKHRGDAEPTLLAHRHILVLCQIRNNWRNGNRRGYYSSNLSLYFLIVDFILPLKKDGPMPLHYSPSGDCVIFLAILESQIADNSICASRFLLWRAVTRKHIGRDFCANQLESHSVVPYFTVIARKDMPETYI